MNKLHLEIKEYTSIVAWLALLISCGCYSNDNNLTYQRNEEFPLVDFNGETHIYKDNFRELIFPRHNEKLTQYCKAHRDWEHIQAVWSKDKIDGQWRWNYFVTKDRKSFKK